MTGEDAVTCTGEWCHVTVPKLLNDGDRGLVGEADGDEEVGNPTIRSHFALVLECVSFDKRNEKLRIEGIFGAVQAVRHFFHGGNDGLKGELGGRRIRNDFLVGRIQERFPSCSNVGFISMVSCFVNKERNVKVASLIGVVVEELDKIVSDCDKQAD